MSGTNKRSYSEYEQALREVLRQSKENLGIAILVGLGMYSSGETNDASAANFLGLSIPEMGRLQEMIVEEALSFFPNEALPERVESVPEWGIKLLSRDEVISCPGCGATIGKDQQVCWDCLIAGGGESWRGR